MTRPALLAVALLALQAPPVPALQGAAEGIPWAKTYEEGLQEAAARNCPLLFTAHKDG